MRYCETGVVQGAFTDKTWNLYLRGDKFTVPKRMTPSVTILDGIINNLNGTPICTNAVVHSGDKNGLHLVRPSDNSKVLEVDVMYSYKYIADAEIY